MNYNFNSGTTLNVPNIPGFQNTDFSQLSDQEIRIFVDTQIQRTIVLPNPLSQFPYQNAIITIIDISGSAARNPIIISGGNFDGVPGPISIDQNHGFIQLGISNYDGGWIILSKLDVVQTLTRQVPSQRCITLNTNPQELLPAPPDNYFIDVLSVFGEAVKGTVPYDGMTSLGIYYDGAAGPLFDQGSVLSGCILNQANPYAAKFTQRPNNGTDNFFRLNSGIYIKALDTNPGQSAGDGEMYIYLTYVYRKRILL